MGIPRISVVIPAHNEELHLGEVLSCLRPLRSECEVDIVVVDVGSNDGTADVARAHNCRVVELDLVHPGIARNRGAEGCSSQVLAFIDGDVLVTSKWIERVLELLDAPEELEGVITGAPYGVRPGGTWIERTWYKTRNPERVTHINAGNMILRREDFQSLGGFDEELQTGEDYDLCRRARRAGMQVLIDNSFHTVHLGYPRTTREFLVREGWHGVGDFQSMAFFIRSKVAIATVLFILSLLLVPVGLLLGVSPLVGFGLSAAFFLCFFSSVAKWGGEGIGQVLRATPIFFLYFSGRALSVFLPGSLLRKWRSS